MPRNRPWLRTKRQVTDLAGLSGAEASRLFDQFKGQIPTSFEGPQAYASREIGETLQGYNEAADVASAGAYTPTVSLTAFASSASAYELSYYRLGDSVFMFGRIDVTPSAAASWTEFKATLSPVLSSFSTVNDVGGSGTAWSHANTPVAFRADTTNDLIHGKFYSVDTNVHEFQCTIGYRVL